MRFALFLSNSQVTGILIKLPGRNRLDGWTTESSGGSLMMVSLMFTAQLIRTLDLDFLKKFLLFCNKKVAPIWNYMQITWSDLKAFLLWECAWTLEQGCQAPVLEGWVAARDRYKFHDTGLCFQVHDGYRHIIWSCYELKWCLLPCCFFFFF